MAPPDALQQIEAAPVPAERAEHEQPRRVGACCRLGMAGGAGKLRRMAVGGELFDECPSEVCVGLDDEDRLAAVLVPGVACCRLMPVALMAVACVLMRRAPPSVCALPGVNERDGLRARFRIGV